MIELPEPARTGGMSVEEAIAARRSVREFRDTPMDMATLSRLLWAAQGITHPARGFRAAPSAGATFPLETYVVTATGVFHYIPRTHALEQLTDEDKRGALARAALGQPWVAKAGANIVFAAVFHRTASRYGSRGRRYVHMEAGHAAQNVLLEAVSLGLGAVPIGAFDDRQLADVLDLPQKTDPLYFISVGTPASP